MLNRLIRAPRPTRLVAAGIALGLTGAWAGTALAAVASQPSEDVTTWPLVVAFLSLIAIPTVASGITAVLLRMSGTGIPPETVVWLVCAVIVAIGYFTAGGALPLIDPADPGATLTGWLLLVTALKSLTQVVYDIVLKRVWPATAPAPA